MSMPVLLPIKFSKSDNFLCLSTLGSILGCSLIVSMKFWLVIGFERQLAGICSSWMDARSETASISSLKTLIGFSCKIGKTFDGIYNRPCNAIKGNIGIPEIPHSLGTSPTDSPSYLVSFLWAKHLFRQLFTTSLLPLLPRLRSACVSI